MWRGASIGRRRAALSALVISVGFLAAGSALPQTDRPRENAGGQPPVAAAQSETSDQPAANTAGGPPSIRSSLGPFGDPGGLNSYLSARGIEYSLTYIGEVFGNPSGGTRRGTVYEGRLDAQLDVDLKQLFRWDWDGATFHANVYQIHGRGLSRNDLSNLFVASGIEALPSTRLYELWVEQKLADGKVAVRAGQLAADTEFFVSQTASLFVNATFGWPAITAANLPSGGPAYPIATPGVRVKLAPTEAWSFLFGAFDGDPAGPARGFANLDPLRRNESGTNFRTSDPAFLIVEAAYSHDTAKDAPGLPGTVKLGYWQHLGRFSDQRFGADGLLLADPLSAGLPARYRGNFGLYAVVDQTLYRVPGTDDGGISVFARLSASPGDRNAIGLYADAGLAYKGLIPGRPDDTFGISFAYARISDRLSGFDRDVGLFAGTPALVRSSEAMIEATYQASIVPGWTVQPDIQYIFRPGAGIANPRDPAGVRIRDAAVVGLRSTIRY